MIRKHTKPSYEFGPFRLDLTEGLLFRDGCVLPLKGKVLELLTVFVQSGGCVLEKDRLMREVWPDHFVEEGNLTINIFYLRKALGESHNEHPYIETIPRRGYRFIAPVRAIGEDQATLATLIPKTRANEFQPIAVLPFKILGAETQEEHLGLGLADALITKLSSLKRIVVRPTSAIRNVNKDPIAAGRQMRVATVLEGSIQRWDEHLRLTVQLVSISDGTTLWAEKFDEKFTNIFALEDSISAQVAKALALQLTTEDEQLLTKRYTEITQAYHAYLKGRYFMEKRTSEGFEKGLEYFELAIKLDPHYALAYAGLADCYIMAGAYDLLSPNNSMPRAKEAALKAVELDPYLAEVRVSLGRIRMFEWDWLEAEREFSLAVELNPNSAIAHQRYGIYLRTMRRFDESLVYIRKATELDPTSASCVGSVGGSLYCLGQYDAAIEQLRQALELDSNNTIAHMVLGRAYVQKGMFRKALAEFEKSTNLFGKGPESLAHLGHTFAVSEQHDSARQVLEELEKLSLKEYVPSYYRALIHIGLGERDQAFAWLEKAYDEHDLNLGLLNFDPIFDSLLADSRLTNLLQRMGLMPPERSYRNLPDGDESAGDGA